MDQILDRISEQIDLAIEDGHRANDENNDKNYRAAHKRHQALLKVAYHYDDAYYCFNNYKLVIKNGTYRNH